MMKGGKRIMHRRIFLVRMSAMSAGLLALVKGKIAWAKVLPSDPGAVAVGAPGPDSVSLAPFEKVSGFGLEKALLERKSIRSYYPSRRLSPEAVSRLRWA